VHAYFTMNENNYSPLIKHLKEWLHRKRLSLQLQLV
jgi:hypothetical protein